MPPKQTPAMLARDLRHRVLACMTKLSDKDTHSQAVSELKSVIIPTLTSDTFSLFIISLSSTSSSDRAAARAAALNLLSSLSSFHGAAVSSHLTKLTSAVVRRLRDPDSAVRSAAAAAMSSFAQNSVQSTSAFVTVLRPLADALATEQEAAAQGAAAMCVAAVIDAAPSEVVDAAAVAKLAPKWMKLLKAEGCKAKAAVLTVMRSVVRARVSNLAREMVNCVVEFLKSEDWATRKAAAELLMEIAVVEREVLSEMKSACLKLFESRKFDKVKGVREAMVQMVEAWKEVPDVFEDGSPPPQSQTSSREHASDGRYPAKSKIYSTIGSNTPQMSRKQVPPRRSSLSDSTMKTTARNRSAPDTSGRRSSTPVYRKPDSKKPSERTTNLHGYDDDDDDDEEANDGVMQRVGVKSSKLETKRGLFIKNPSSRVMPYAEDCSEATLTNDNSSKDNCRHQKDSEDLSLIREQLVQIENQQSSLMDILQKFIGTSQDGMRTLETRVHGLERALDGISYDLAVSTARMSNVEPPRSSCCLLPGSDFLSSKFWRRPGAHSSTSRFPFSDGTPGNGVGLESRRFHLRGPGGGIMNPLAEIPCDPRVVLDASSNRVLRSVRTAA